MVLRLHLLQKYSIIFWTFLLVIGLVTGLIAFFSSLIVSVLLYYTSTLYTFDLIATENINYSYLSYYVLFNLVVCVIAGALVLGIAPMASGSGIPNMVAYLNGIDLPNFLTLKVALIKIPGSILVACGSLCVGKEGPLLHIGSIVATYLGNTGLFQSLKKDRDQMPFTYEQHARELVVCGAAAGLAAGFGAPIGGLLFAMEMASRWRAEVTWRSVFICVTVTTVIYIAKKIFKYLSRADEILNYGSLLFFSDEISYDDNYLELPYMIILGIIGGFIGCLYTTININLGAFRYKYKHIWYWRILEIVLASLITSILRLVLPIMGTCIKYDVSKDKCTSNLPGDFCNFNNFTLYGCKEDEYNDMAVLTFNPQGYVIKSLFVTPYEGFSMFTLFVFFIFYYFMAMITYGSAIPAGLFTPSLIIGGSLGHLYATIINAIVSAMGFSYKINPGLYGLLGAASILGGMFRFTVSFLVILIELTNTQTEIAFLMVVLLVAKGIGDRFNQNILYHLCILLGLPFIGGYADSIIRQKGRNVSDIMDKRPIVLRKLENKDIIMTALEKNTRDGKTILDAFPVVADIHRGQAGDLIGMVHAIDLIELMETLSTDSEAPDMVDLTSIIKLPPIVISPNMTLTSIFRLKNSTGLEYLPVVSSYGPLRGYITRNELLNCQNSDIDPHNLQRRMEKLTHLTTLQRQRSTLDESNVPLLTDTTSTGEGTSRPHEFKRLASLIVTTRD